MTTEEERRLLAKSHGDCTPISCVFRRLLDEAGECAELREALREALDIAEEGTWQTVRFGARERIAELRKRFNLETP